MSGICNIGTIGLMDIAFLLLHIFHTLWNLYTNSLKEESHNSGSNFEMTQSSENKIIRIQDVKDLENEKRYS